MSTLIKVSCIDQDLKVTEKPVVASGGIKETEIEFTFDDLWTGFTKYAVFYKEITNSYKVTLDEDNKAVVPHEVTNEKGKFYFGVCGINSSTGVARTSKVIPYEVEQGAIVGNLQTSDANPSILTELSTLLGGN